MKILYTLTEKFNETFQAIPSYCFSHDMAYNVTSLYFQFLVPRQVQFYMNDCEIFKVG